MQAQEEDISAMFAIGSRRAAGDVHAGMVTVRSPWRRRRITHRTARRGH